MLKSYVLLFPQFFRTSTNYPQTNMIIFGISALFWELRNVRYILLLDPLLYAKSITTVLFRGQAVSLSAASPPPLTPGWVAFEKNIVEPNNFYRKLPQPDPLDRFRYQVIHVGNYDCARLSYV